MGAGEGRRDGLRRLAGSPDEVALPCVGQMSHFGHRGGRLAGVSQSESGQPPNPASDAAGDTRRPAGGSYLFLSIPEGVPTLAAELVPSSFPSPYDPSDPVYALHRGGKLGVCSSVPVRDRDDLSLAYTPGVARVCRTIADEPALVHDLTWKGNTVAVVTDGTAVLGLGDIGPAAALPVMEGKALLFKQFGGVDAVPLCLDCTDVDELVETVVRLAPGFGGINLEDISAPRCFEVERRLQESLDIPIFHDDQHGTAIVVLAALRNASRVTGRALADLRAVISGAGAAGVAVARILLSAGIGDVSVADSRGVVHQGRADLTQIKQELAAETNRGGLTGALVDALVGADVFIGVSAGQVPEATVAAMAPDAIVFALANPDPEIHPDVAKRHARVVATGRSDFPNQINNVLAFPGVFRGALDVRASRITEGMKLAAAAALADVVGDRLSETMIVPSPFDPQVGPAVAAAVAAAAQREGVTRRSA
jgi:malate dehydrogenase (oxaloacetate-decarboxylating)